jgi:hypothetical protein
MTINLCMIDYKLSFSKIRRTTAHSYSESRATAPNTPCQKLLTHQDYNPELPCFVNREKHYLQLKFRSGHLFPREYVY